MSGEEPDNFVENCGVKYRINTLKHFRRFRDFCVSDGWKEECHTDSVQVFTRAPEVKEGEKPSGLNINRMICDWPLVEPETMFNALHDHEFRKTWDTNMLLGYNICQLDSRNDIGYYGVKFPWPLMNRDFCNMRSWMEFGNGEFIIMNYTVKHPECPPKKDYVRANSILTGYYMIPNKSSGGMTFIYCSHVDLCGSIPHALLNYGVTKTGPSMMERLYKTSQGYTEWSQQHNPANFVGPWRTPKVDWETGQELLVPRSPRMGGSQLPFDRQMEISAGSTNDEGMPRGDHSGVATLQLERQVEDLKRKLFVATQRGESMTLAPVAPARPDDTMSVQQYRALMNDIVNFVDRQYLQEGRTPTIREYLFRVHSVLDGIRRTMPVG